MKLATWNINGIKARKDLVLDWLKQAQPDLVALQEIKSIDDNFPVSEFENAGYKVETHGQKSYNGVAILSKMDVKITHRGLPGDETDEQARYIEASLTAGENTLTVGGIYLPNGNPAPGPKFDYKLAWLDRLEAHAAQLISAEKPAILMGDFNIIPQGEDCYAPSQWTEDALFRPQSRAAYQRLLAQGWTDGVRAAYPAGSHYTYWDYQAGSWPKDLGIRIDHVLLSPQAADMLTSVKIDREERDKEKPSDHVPVICELAL